MPDDAARNWLALRGYDKAYGARPLSRLVQEQIKPLADHLLFGDLEQGGVVEVSVVDDALQVSVAASGSRSGQAASGQNTKANRLNANRGAKRS